MAQHFLKAKDVTPIKQVIFGKSMPESVWGNPRGGDTCSLSVAAQQLLDAAPGKRQAIITEQQPGYLQGQRFRSTGVDIFPQRLLDQTADRHYSLTVTL